MKGEAGATFNIQKDPAQGIIVVDAWIRGPKWQTVAPFTRVAPLIQAALQLNPNSN